MHGMPILAYHKLGPLPSGAKMKSLYIGEKLFAWQMRELYRAGFGTKALDVWHKNSRPDHRRVILTFDDGSRTVLQHALPVLAQYRITTVQFLVANAIGGTNHWDVGSRGEVPDPLMDVSQVRDWLSAGQEIGSHTLNHVNLTAVPSPKRKRSARRRSWRTFSGCDPSLLLSAWQMVVPDEVLSKGRLHDCGHAGFRRKYRDPRSIRPPKDRRQTPLA
jgi:peptidoglycan/xylan/chitin deacetylase (PgdA/CDA1 family)